MLRLVLARGAEDAHGLVLVAVEVRGDALGQRLAVAGLGERVLAVDLEEDPGAELAVARGLGELDEVEVRAEAAALGRARGGGAEQRGEEDLLEAGHGLVRAVVVLWWRWVGCSCEASLRGGPSVEPCGGMAVWLRLLWAMHEAIAG